MRAYQFLRSFSFANVSFKSDLKPANIGFDQQGKVKIFDFGLSREYVVNAEGKNTVKPRRMTGGAGTLRYMAPEVARLEESYGFPADVHSFAILLWQIVTNRVPFAKLVSRAAFEAQVINGNLRPSLKEVYSDSLKGILSVGWSPNPDQRPTFAWIAKELGKIIETRPSTVRVMSDSSLLASNQQQPKEKTRHVAKGLVRHLLAFTRQDGSNPDGQKKTFMSKQLASPTSHVNPSNDVLPCQQPPVSLTDTSSSSSISGSKDIVVNPSNDVLPCQQPSMPLTDTSLESSISRMRDIVVDPSKDVLPFQQPSAPLIDAASDARISRSSRDIVPGRTTAVVTRGQMMLADDDLISPAPPRRR